MNALLKRPNSPAGCVWADNKLAVFEYVNNRKFND